MPTATVPTIRALPDVVAFLNGLAMESGRVADIAAAVKAQAARPSPPVFASGPRKRRGPTAPADLVEWVSASIDMQALQDARTHALPMLRPRTGALGPVTPESVQALGVTVTGDAPLVPTTPAVDRPRRIYHVPPAAWRAVAPDDLMRATVQSAHLAMLAGETARVLDQAAASDGLSRRTGAGLKAEADAYRTIGDDAAVVAVDNARDLAALIGPPDPRKPAARRIENAPITRLNLN